MQAPVSERWKLVVVLGITLAEKAQQVLVYKVEPEESGIAHPSENVPWRRDQQEEQSSAHQAKFTPPSPLTRDQQIGKQCPYYKDNCDQSFGRHCKRERSVGRIPQARCSPAIKGQQSKVKGRGDGQGQQRLGNKNSGKQVVADAGDDEQSSIDAGASAKGAPGPVSSKDHEQEDRECRWQASRDLRNTYKPIAACH